MFSTKKIFKLFIIIFGFGGFSLIFLNSLFQIYENKEKIAIKLGLSEDHHDDHGPRYMANPLSKSKRQLPQNNFKDLKIDNNADEVGQWSAPFDWNVTAIHSTLLPNESVLTFGTFGIEHKHDGHMSENKNIKITDGRTLSRDEGFHQWEGHDVNSGIDFDIWDTKKGFSENAHFLLKKPLVMDAFCSMVRVIDDETVLIVGGNKNPNTSIPDTQAGTMIYNINSNKFFCSFSINYYLFS